MKAALKIYPKSNQSVMKIRAVTIGIEIAESDFSDNKIASIIRNAVENLTRVSDLLQSNDYVVQTVRICLNSFEEWNPCLDMTIFDQLFNILVEFDVKLCALGNCLSKEAIAIIPILLARCDRISCSVQLFRDPDTIFAPDYEICLAAAEACLGVAASCGDWGNFRYCIGFNCPPGIPFFPTSYHHKSKPNNLITIGLENADILFLSFHGATSLLQGQENLTETFRQLLTPIQTVLVDFCASNPDINFNGIDASINPGLTIPESVGAGMETILNLITPGKKFGTFGTLTAVSAITSAIKRIRDEGHIKLAGYSGLMLPVMEDLILAERGAEEIPTYTLRDLLVFSSVCGVGLDTVPIPGNAQAEDIAAVYMETGTMAFRLNKPLTTRLLPIAGKVAGELSDVNHPCLVNTKILGFH